MSRHTIPRWRRALPAWILVSLLAGSGLDASPGDEPEGQTIVVGSKKFTESVILGETLSLLAREAGWEVRHRRELGGTRVLWNALVAGDIDAYVEYTGTLREEIFAGRSLSDADLPAAVAEHGLRLSLPLGFNNTYAIGLRRELAAEQGLRQISDLRRHPDLVLGFTNEFLDRGDGWPGLRRRYRLPHQDVRGLDHDLAYQGLEAGTLQVMDLYSTDAEIAYYDLKLLDDDLGHFPAYQALVLYRDELAPTAKAALLRLEGRIDEGAMVAMNARAKLDKVPEALVAADFLAQEMGIVVEVEIESRAGRLWRTTRDHLTLVMLSLLAAILVALPLGILAARRPRLGQVVLGVVSVLQTIPSLALLVFMIPLLGIGAPPALAALFVYSLLPIVRNTHAGLRDIAPEILESADALGLPPGTRLRRIELPLAWRSILAGVKTSAVINIGTTLEDFGPGPLNCRNRCRHQILRRRSR